MDPYTEMKMITARADAEKRDLTKDETKRFDELWNETAFDDKRSSFPPSSARSAPSDDEDDFDDRWDRDKSRSESPIIAKDQSVLPFFRSKGLAKDEYRGLSFGQYIRATVCGARTAAEKRALAEGTDSTGGYTVPSILLGQFIDALRARTVTIQAGAQTVPLTTDDTSIAKLATDPQAAWRLENSSVDESDPTFSRIRFQPKTLACIVRASRELVEDSANLEQAMMNAFAGSMSVELDRVALLGAAADDEPVGVANSGITALALDDYPMGYGVLLEALETIEEANAGPATAAIMAPRTKSQFAKLLDTTGQPMRKPDELQTLPLLATTSIPVGEATAENESRIIVGDYRQLYIGVRTSLRVELLRERYADNLQYAWLAYLRADVAVAHSESFAQITGVLPTPAGVAPLYALPE